MFQESLDSRGHAVPVIGSVCPEITPSRIIPLEHSLDPCLWMPELHLEGFMR